jgi:hypothetical protein
VVKAYEVGGTYRLEMYISEVAALHAEDMKPALTTFENFKQE